MKKEITCHHLASLYLSYLIFFIFISPIPSQLSFLRLVLSAVSRKIPFFFPHQDFLLTENRQSLVFLDKTGKIEINTHTNQ